MKYLLCARDAIKIKEHQRPSDKRNIASDYGLIEDTKLYEDIE